jgi:hypothetical protein
MSGKVYIGVRLDRRVEVTVIEDSGQRAHALCPRLDLVNHSSRGFEYGYGGSGPSQLALALCADALGDDVRAKKIHQAYKWAHVVHFEGERWRLTADEVRQACERLEREQNMPGVGAPC